MKKNIDAATEAFKQNNALFPKKTTKKSVGDCVILICFVFCALITLYPIYYVLIGSFNQGKDYISGGIWLFPRVITFDNYIFVLNDQRLYSGLFITLARTALGVITSLIFTSCVAYAMSRKKLVCRKFFYWINIFTMFFNGGLIPFYILIVNIGLYNNFFVYIIPGLYSVFNMIIMSSFFSGIPEDLHEAAEIDGASEFYIMFSIYFRLSGAVFATVGLWIGVAHWNAYFDTMIYCSANNSLHTLQYYLMRVIKEASRPADTSNIPPSVLEEISDSVYSCCLCVSIFAKMF